MGNPVSNDYKSSVRESCEVAMWLKEKVNDQWLKEMTPISKISLRHGFAFMLFNYPHESDTHVQYLVAAFRWMMVLTRDAYWIFFRIQKAL